MNSLISKSTKYTKLVIASQKKGKFTSNYSKGYYLSNLPEIRQLENLFLQEVPNQKNHLISKIKKGENISSILQLLGWSKDYKIIPNLLLKYISHHNVSVSNSAMRALFPMVASGKYKLNENLIIPLIYKRSKYVKNKALGLLAFSGANLDKKIDKAYIEKLSNHQEPMVSGPAQMLLENLTKY